MVGRETDFGDEKIVQTTRTGMQAMSVYMYKYYAPWIVTLMGIGGQSALI